MDITLRYQDAMERVLQLSEDFALRHRAFQLVSNEFNLNEHNFRKWFSLHKSDYPGFNPAMKFGPKTESILVAICLQFSAIRRPLDDNGLSEMIKMLTKEKVSKKWIKDFINRHSSLLVRKRGKLFSPKREKPNLLEETDTFISEWGSLIDSGLVNENNLFVCDETRVGMPTTDKNVIGYSGLESQHVEEWRGEAFCTFLPFSRANGTTPFRAYIFKNRVCTDDDCEAELALPNLSQTLKRKLGIEMEFFHQTQTGYIDKEAYKKIIIEFCGWWNTIHPGLYCFVLADQLPVHRDPDILKLALERNVFLWSIMSGTSHWFQVHDQFPFGLLKKMIKSKVESLDWRPTLSAKQRHTMMAGVFYECERIAMQPSVLKAAFDFVGLHPFNPARIRERAEKQVDSLDKAETSKLIKDACDAVEKVLEKHDEAISALSSTVKRRKTTNNKCAVFSPQKIIENADKIAKEKKGNAKDTKKRPRQVAKDKPKTTAKPAKKRSRR